MKCPYCNWIIQPKTKATIWEDDLYGDMAYKTNVCPHCCMEINSERCSVEEAEQIIAKQIAMEQKIKKQLAEKKKGRS